MVSGPTFPTLHWVGLALRRQVADAVQRQRGRLLGERHVLPLQHESDRAVLAERPALFEAHVQTEERRAVR